MKNKYWRTEDNKKVLIFTPFYDEEVVAEIFKDEDGDWCYTSSLLNESDMYLCERDICEHDAKLEVEEMIYGHYQDERDYFQDMMDKFSGEEN